MIPSRTSPLLGLATAVAVNSVAATGEPRSVAAGYCGADVEAVAVVDGAASQERALPASGSLQNTAERQPAESPRVVGQSEHWEAAASYSEAHGGYAVLVMHRGEVLFERHAAGSSPDRAHPLASGTKSFCGVMLAAAIEDGLVSSFDELVSDTIAEWRADPRLGRVTLRELLSLSGGVEGGPVGRPPSYAESTAAKAFASPGERFRYGPIPFQVFGEVMRRKLQPRGEGVREYLQRRILDPIGVRVGGWRNDADGNPNLCSGAGLSAREWAKFGELLRNGGRIADGQTRGREGTVDGARDPAQLIRSDLLEELRHGSRANRGYGVSLWLLDDEGGPDPEAGLREDARTRIRERPRAAAPQLPRPAEAPRSRAPGPSPREQAGQAQRTPGSGDERGETLPSARTDASRAALAGAFMAAGLGKQRLYVLPALELVVVRQGDLDRASAFSDREFLARLTGLGAAEPPEARDATPPAAPR